MNFSWMDFEVAKLYREACLKEAQDRRLIRHKDMDAVQRNIFAASKMTRIGKWLERQGRNLQWLAQESSALGPRGASYE